MTVNNKLKGSLLWSRHSVIRGAVWTLANGTEKFQDSRYSGQDSNQRNVSYTSEDSALETTSGIIGESGGNVHGQVVGYTCVTRLCVSSFPEAAADCVLFSTYFLCDLFQYEDIEAISLGWGAFIQTFLTLGLPEVQTAAFRNSIVYHFVKPCEEVVWWDLISL